MCGLSEAEKGLKLLRVVRQGYIENKASEQSLEKERKEPCIYARKGTQEREAQAQKLSQGHALSVKELSQRLPWLDVSEQRDKKEIQSEKQGSEYM